MTTATEPTRDLDAELDEALDRLLRCEVRAEGEPDSRRLRFIASTQRVARDGDIIEAQAWRFDDFLEAHPSFLWGHDADRLVGKVVAAEIVLARGEPRLEVVVEFDTSPEGDRVLGLYRRGFLKSVSVRWITKEYRKPSTEERAKLGLGEWGVVITRAELLEVSAVTVPSDPGAVLVGPERSAVRADLVAIRGDVPAESVEKLDGMISRLGIEEALDRLTSIETKLGDLVEHVEGLRSSVAASGSATPSGAPDVPPERSGSRPYDPLDEIRKAFQKPTPKGEIE